MVVGVLHYGQTDRTGKNGKICNHLVHAAASLAAGKERRVKVIMC